MCNGKWNDELGSIKTDTLTQNANTTTTSHTFLFLLLYLHPCLLTFNITSVLLDPEVVHHIAQMGEEAARVVLMECDQEECVMVDGWKEMDGWHFSEGLQEGHGPHNHKVLMWDLDDTE